MKLDSGSASPEIAATACPFCSPPPEKVVFDRDHALALWDAFPVSPGHALVVPRRHVASWSALASQEKAALLELVDEVRELLDERHAPDGYNIGLNDGIAAGQTVMHVHVHVIPRYAGDMPDPRGGLRHVLPCRRSRCSTASSIAARK